MKIIVFFITVFIWISPNVVLGETLKDLVQRDGLFFKRYEDIPFTGTIDGHESGTIINGLRHGFWRVFYSDGQLKSKGNYQNGIKDGKWIGYRPNGFIHYEGEYLKGKQHGLWTHYWENKVVGFQGTFINGEKHGKWVGYERDGTISNHLTGFFENGIKVK